MGTTSRSTSTNTRRDEGSRNGGPPARAFAAPDSGEIDSIRSTAGMGASRPGASWRSWLVYMLTIGVLVSATAVFVNYIVKVPPSLTGDVKQAGENAAAALEGVSSLQRNQIDLEAKVTDIASGGGAVVALEQQLGALKANVDSSEAEMAKLQGRIDGLPLGEDAAEVREALAAVKLDVADLKKRVRALESLERHVQQTEARLAALEQGIDLPSGTTLTDYVARVAREFARAGNGGDGIALLRGDLNSEVGRLEEDIRKLGSRLAVLPSGSIVAWHASGAVPAGWAECNGRNGTPDLRGRFLRGTSGTSGVGRRGGGGSGSTSHQDHWHHSDTWTDSSYRGKKAVILVQGAAHPGKGVYAFYGHRRHESGGAAPPAYVSTRFIMKL